MSSESSSTLGVTSAPPTVNLEAAAVVNEMVAVGEVEQELESGRVGAIGEGEDVSAEGKQDTQLVKVRSFSAVSSVVDEIDASQWSVAVLRARALEAEELSKRALKASMRMLEEVEVRLKKGASDVEGGSAEKGDEEGESSNFLKIVSVAQRFCDKVAIDLTQDDEEGGDGEIKSDADDDDAAKKKPLAGGGNSKKRGGGDAGAVFKKYLMGVGGAGKVFPTLATHLVGIFDALLHPNLSLWALDEEERRAKFVDGIGGLCKHFGGALGNIDNAFISEVRAAAVGAESLSAVGGGDAALDDRVEGGAAEADSQEGGGVCNLRPVVTRMLVGEKRGKVEADTWMFNKAACSFSLGALMRGVQQHSEFKYYGTKKVDKAKAQIVAAVTSFMSSNDGGGVRGADDNVVDLLFNTLPSAARGDVGGGKVEEGLVRERNAYVCLVELLRSPAVFLNTRVVAAVSCGKLGSLQQKVNKVHFLRLGLLMKAAFGGDAHPYSTMDRFIGFMKAMNLSDSGGGYRVNTEGGCIGAKDWFSSAELASELVELAKAWEQPVIVEAKEDEVAQAVQ